MNIGGLLTGLADRLGGDWPGLDAQLIVAHVLDQPRTWLLAHPEVEIAAADLDVIESAVNKLESGISLPYILGHWEFFGLDLAITTDVLIPRPETELLVERGIAWLQASPDRRTVADIGTGSGAIGIALAVHVPDAYVLGTDLSLPALKVARSNARKFGVEDRVDFVNCDLLPAHHERLATDLHFDLICANLPYIPTDTLKDLAIYGREPALALDGGKDGLDPIRRLLSIAPEWLAPGGRILLEIEATLGIQALSLVYDFFNQAEIHLHKDLTGRDRLLEIQF